MREEEIRRERSDAPAAVPYGETVWNSRVQWGAILAGAFAGFAVTLLMTTLGAAIGITAGAAGVMGAEGADRETAETAATGFGIGLGVWMLLTALATGLIGGWVLNATSRRDRGYSSVLFGGITWAVGVCLLLLLVTPSVGGLFSGMGAGAGTAAATAANQQPGILGRMGQAAPQTDPSRPMSDEEKAAARDAAEKAATAATAAAWFMFGSQLVALGATILAAGRHRHTGTRVVTEIRPRPAPLA